MKRWDPKWVWTIMALILAGYAFFFWRAFSGQEWPDISPFVGLFLVLATISQVLALFFFGLMFREGVTQTGGRLGILHSFRGAMVGGGVVRVIPAGGAVSPVAMAFAVQDTTPNAGGAAVRATVTNYSKLLIGTGLALLWIRTRGLASIDALIFALGVAGIFVGVALLAGTSRLGWAVGKLPKRLRSRIEGHFHNVRPTVGLIAMAAIRLFFETLAMWFVLEAFGLHLTPSQALAAFGLSQLFGGLFGTPGGAGFTEAGLVGVLAAFGYPPALTLGPILVYRVISYWIPVLLSLFAGGVAFVKVGQTETESEPAG